MNTNTNKIILQMTCVYCCTHLVSGGLGAFALLAGWFCPGTTTRPDGRVKGRQFSDVSAAVGRMTATSNCCAARALTSHGLLGRAKAHTSTRRPKAYSHKLYRFLTATTPSV